MMITPYNLLRHELVGLPVRVDAPGGKIEGMVEWETAKTITIKTSRGSKRVEKGACTFEFTLPLDAICEVAGRLLAGRPEERIKKRHRIRF